MRGHGSRVGELAVTLAIRLGWDGAELRRLRIGARLHDLGKLAVTDDVWRKRERLTDAEVEAIRRHPAAGMQMLSRQPQLRFAVPLALFHHERWDGRGYPIGLREEQIPLAARVFAIADSFDAMTSDRPYRAAMSFGEAFEEIRLGSGTQFDPDIVEVFLDLASEGGLWAEPAHEEAEIAQAV